MRIMEILLRELHVSLMIKGVVEYIGLKKIKETSRTSTNRLAHLKEKTNVL